MQLTKKAGNIYVVLPSMNISTSANKYKYLGSTASNRETKGFKKDVASVLFEMIMNTKKYEFLQDCELYSI